MVDYPGPPASIEETKTNIGHEWWSYVGLFEIRDWTTRISPLANGLLLLCQCKMQDLKNDLILNTFAPWRSEKYTSPSHLVHKVLVSEFSWGKIAMRSSKACQSSEVKRKTNRRKTFQAKRSNAPGSPNQDDLPHRTEAFGPRIALVLAAVTRDTGLDRHEKWMEKRHWFNSEA